MTESSLNVFLDGKHAGSIRQSEQGRHSFTYDADYLASENPTPLSLSMPLSAIEHGAKNIDAFMLGLLPDSPEALERIAKIYDVRSAKNPFELLRHVGQDAAGAVQILPLDRTSDDAGSQGDIEWLSESDVGALLRSLEDNSVDWDPGRRTGRWSLAGAQSKIALHQGPDGRWGIPRDATPTTHILKPAIRGFANHDVNEFMSLHAARRLGIPSAVSSLRTFPGADQVFISRRYDRRLENERWIRIHQEDFLQANGIKPALKYQVDGGPGVAKMAETIRRFPLENQSESARRFFSELVFNVSIGATDAHAKNYSIVLQGDEAILSPFYDVASAIPYDLDTPNTTLDSAMKIGDEYRINAIGTRHWVKAGASLRIPADEAESIANDIRDRVVDAFFEVAEEVDKENWAPEGVAKRIASNIEEHYKRHGREGRARSTEGPAGTGSQDRVPKGDPDSNGGRFAGKRQSSPEVSLE